MVPSSSSVSPVESVGPDRNWSGPFFFGPRTTALTPRERGLGVLTIQISGGGWTRTSDPTDYGIVGLSFEGLRPSRLVRARQRSRSLTPSDGPPCTLRFRLVAAARLEPATLRIMRPSGFHSRGFAPRAWFARDSAHGRSPRATAHRALYDLDWWRRLDSNQRPTDYETVGLSFEGLRPSRLVRARQRSRSLTPSDGPPVHFTIQIGGGGWTRTSDLRIMRPSGFHSRGFAPRAWFARDSAHGRSPRATAHRALYDSDWWRRLDSNQRPTDYETVALAT